jgi:hypothetical protein
MKMITQSELCGSAQSTKAAVMIIIMIMHNFSAILHWLLIAPEGQQTGRSCVMYGEGSTTE